MRKPRMKRGTLRRIIAEELQLARRTGHTIDSNYLYSALRQRGYLLEAEDKEGPIPVDQEELGDSLDRQVDRYLASYENGAKTGGSEPKEQMEWRDLVRSIALVEAPEDKEGGAEGPEGEGGDELPETKPGPSVPEAPPKLGLDDIDVEMFANDVARLIQNYDSLLEVRRTLLRRAVNFIAKNYDEQVVKELEMSLREDHGLMSDKSPREYESEEFTAPYAGEAGPGGGAA